MSNPPIQERGRLWRFSLRSLLVLIAVIAAGVGVAGRRVAEVRTERSVAAEIQRLGGYLRFQERAPVPEWLTRWLGEDFFADLYLAEIDSPLLSDDTLVQLAKLRHLEWLLLDSDRITDRGLRRIAKLSELCRLDLASRHITDDGLAALETLRNLRWLALRRTQVTSQGVERLRSVLPDCEVHWDPPVVPTAPSPPADESQSTSNRLAQN